MKWFGRKRYLAEKLAWSYLGKWYKWGGDDPSGFDCSGFVIEILKSVGILPRWYDGTSRDLYREFIKKKVGSPYRGCLVFYGDPITHIEFCIDGEFSIGASGGGSKTRTVQDAIEQNAFIKMRPIKRERYAKTIKYVDPF